VFELAPDHFDRIKPLFDETQPNSTMIFSTLEGRTLGTAFVDDLVSPSNCLLIMGFQHFSFTHATVDQAWLNETVAALRPRMSFLLNWPPDFSPAIQPPPNFSRVLAGYEFIEYNPQWELIVPPNRQLRLMDADLLERATWRDLTLQAYGTFENFLAKGVGVCVMDGEEICSEAYACFLGAGKYEIGIVTNERYCREGNAYLACKRLLQLVEEMGYPPHWSYFEGNAASAATARKLGFGAH
jgi:hypothetical protein